MRFKSEDELKKLNIRQLVQEKLRAYREMQTSKFLMDPERQFKPAKPTDSSPNVQEPTLKQLEDYLAQIDKLKVKK